MQSRISVLGYAIVSEDGMIADASGVMPPSLKIDADQEFFARGLDQADVLVHGRQSQEHQPGSPARRRLIVTHQIPALASAPSSDKVIFWNPAGASFEQALAMLGLSQGRVAILGGTDVFALFLDRYDIFYLSRAAGVHLSRGRPVFSGVPAATPEAILAAHGLAHAQTEILDPVTGFSVTGYTRPAPPQ